MGNEDELSTRQKIILRRRQLARKRRRAMIKLFFLLLFGGALLLAIMFVGYKLVSWGNNMYEQYQAMYAGYTARQHERRGDVDARFDGYTNILVLGVDAGADEADDSGKRADTIVVVSLDNATGQVRFINIPRDTWVTPPAAKDGTKLKTLYAMGGAPLMVREVNSLLGISIHQYVVLDMQTFADLIDVLGGIDIYVEEPMVYEDTVSSYRINLAQGYQHLDGKMAEQYLRYRSPELGDVGRVQRQQKFIKALYQEILQLKTVPRLPEIADIFQNRMETSAEIFDSAHLANVLRGMSTDIPTSIMLPGAPAENDETIWVPDSTLIEERIEELFPADTLIDTTDNEEEK